MLAFRWWRRLVNLMRTSKGSDMVGVGFGVVMVVRLYSSGVMSEFGSCT